MRKLIITFLLASVSILCFAQSSHLTIKGTPIDGTGEEFVSELQERGFQLLSSNESGVYILVGEYDGYKNCRVGVYTLDCLDLAFTAAIIFPDCDNWTALESNYRNMKSILSNRYSTPTMCVEQFENTVADQDKLHEVQFDRCRYGCLFSTDKGDIELSIEHDESYSCYVVMRLTDEINRDLVRKAMSSSSGM